MNRFKFPKIHLFDEDSKSGIPHGNITYIIAFAIPLIMFIALYYARNIFPFGTNCYLRSDMYHQYAPFFSEFWNKLATGGSLTYSWDIGMGTNFTALYAYYLASPSNWLIVLFPQKYMIEIMNAIIILKLSAASVTFTYYITKRFHNKSCVIALFGMFYAMSGYVAAYSWNIMWLDCIILVPLIFLGLEKLVNENKCFLFSISLGICVFSNYYISIMVCMTVIIYFIVLMIAYDGPRHFRIYLKKFLNFGIYSLIAGGLAACLLLPEMYALSLSASSDMSFPKTLTSYFPIMEMMVRQLITVPVHLGLDHYPNIYCGVAIFMLIPLYIMNPKISSRQKAGKVFILLIFLTAFNMNIPNFVWHGLHFPNSLPCRQSFIYIFFILSMSYEAVNDIKNYSKKEMTGALWVALIFLFLAEQLYAGSTYNFKIMYISGAFMLLYMLFMYLYRSDRFKKPVLLFFIFATAIIECTINMEATGLSTTGRTYYVNDNEAVNTVIDYVSANDPTFYRIEKVTGIRSKNDASWHNYKSISTFSSTANAGVTDLYAALGCESSTNAYAFKGSTLVTSSIFGVKYYLGNKLMTESSLFQYYYGHNGEFLYENKNVLPIGFMIKSDINELWKLSPAYTSFDNQNDFIEINTGIANVLQKAYEFRTEPDVTFSPTINGHMYLCPQNRSVESIGVSINNVVTNYTGLDDGDYIVDIGYVMTTDNIQVYGNTSMNLLVYSLDPGKYTTAMNTLKQCALNVTEHTDTKITGTVTATNDGAMFFSIPFDKGWTAKVDGKKVDTFAVKDAMLAINVGAGTHEIKLSYVPVGLIPGLTITISCILILLFMILFRRFEKKGRISTKKLPAILREFFSQEDILFNKATIKDKIIKMIGGPDNDMEFNQPQKAASSADNATDVDYMPDSDYNSDDELSYDFENEFEDDLEDDFENEFENDLETELKNNFKNDTKKDTKYDTK